MIFPSRPLEGMTKARILPAFLKVDKTVSIEQRHNGAWYVKCRVKGGRKLDTRMAQLNHFYRSEIYIESAGGVRPRRFRLFLVCLKEYSSFDKNGMRTLGFTCGGLEKVEMKVPKMWGAA